MTDLFTAPAVPRIPVAGQNHSFPVHRIYCVGRNFADHAKEMGSQVDRGNPVFFSKPADAIVALGGDVLYPPGTNDLHHEVELVAALGNDVPADVTLDNALNFVYGYAVGLDLTRRDLQAAAKSKGLPWDTAKGFDQSAPISAIVPVAGRSHPYSEIMTLAINGQIRQQSALSEMVFSVTEIIVALSGLYQLRAGDLLFMGTPAGVAALQCGDRFDASITGWAQLQGNIV